MTDWRKLGLITLASFIFMAGCSDEESKQETRPVEKQSLQENGESEVRQNQLKSSQPSPKQQSEEQMLNEKKVAKLTKQEQKKLAELKSKVLFYQGPSFKKQVALTFDDGPDRHFTLQVLDILKQEQVSATFFVVGNLARKYPDVLARMDREGHVIGNHSYNHPQLTKIPIAQVDKQLQKTNSIIHQAIHKTPILFRPPYGSIDSKLEDHIGKKGFKIIQWSVDTVDWKGPSSQQIVHTVKKNTRPGGIILQHSAGGEQLQQSVDALPEIIRHFKSQGYEFVTVDQLLHVPAYVEEQEEKRAF